MRYVVFCGIILLFCSSLTAGNKPDTVNLAQKRVKVAGAWYKQFSGTIGKTITIDFDLTYRRNTNADTTVFGHYYYAKNGQPVYIDGALRRDSTITLYEYNDTGGVKAEFNATIVGGGLMTGTYKNLKTKQEFPFTVTENRRGIGALPITFVSKNCKRRDSLSSVLLTKEFIEDTACSETKVSWFYLNSGNSQLDSDIQDTLASWLLQGISKKNFSEVLNISHLTSEDYQEEDYWISMLYNERQIISVLAGAYSFNNMAAHPGSWFYVANYDLATGKKITYQDLIPQKNMQAFKKKCEELFYRINGAEGDWFFGNDGKFELSEQFSIVRGGLLLRYNSYEAGSYAQGQPEVFVPLQEIKSLMAPGTILDRLGF